MRCCVPFCKNTPDNVSTENKGISFHAFPSEVCLRGAWLRALGKQDSHLPDSAVVCSQHFLNEDIYETDSGLKQIRTGALPSTVQVCMICLDTDSKLLLMSKHKLDEAYEKLSGYALCDQGNLKQTVCVQCAQRLINFTQFRDKILRARSLMMDLVEKHESITRRHIKMINRTTNRLKSDIVVTLLGPDPCDLYILEHPSEDEQTDSEATIFRVVVKNEGSCDSMLVDEDTEAANEDENNADCVNDEFDEENTSGASVKTETKLLDEAVSRALERQRAVFEQEAGTLDLLKFESAPFQCTVCFEEFLHEHTHMRHMRIHLQGGARDGECASRACEPRAGSSGSSHSSLTENRQAVRKPHDETHSSAELAQTAVGPATARHATGDENKARRSPQVDKVNSGQSDADSVPDISRLTNCVVVLFDVFKKSVFQDKVKVSNRNVSNTLRSDDSENETCLLIGRNLFTCDVCRKMFKRKCHLVGHIQTHTEVTSFACKYCEYECKYKENLTAHMRTHTGEKPYSCELCKYKCSDSGNLVRHMRTHTGEKPYTCELCKYKCARKGHLATHMKTHTGEKPYSCELCKYKCAQKQHLATHMKTHTGEKPHSCGLCKYKCSDSGNLVRHMRTHTGEKPYLCELCKYKCSDSGSLVRHMRTHTGEKPYSCELCKYKCSYSGDLVKHMRTHTGEKPYTCELCKYKCARKGHLATHMKTHTGEKPYSCELCKYKCAQKQHLATHMKTHTGEKPHSCGLCKYKCSDSGNLVRHMRTHTGEKPYLCELCKYKCSDSGDLVRHMRTHTGEKPYTCELCKYKCARKGHLATHMKTHTGEKPYSCELCKYKCAQKQHLATHMKTHTGEKPHSCGLCKYKCSDSGNLVRHMRTHTGEKPYLCELCKYKCSDSGSLVRHMRTHTGEKPYLCELCKYKCSGSGHLVRHMRTHT